MPRIRIQRMESELEQLFSLALSQNARDPRLQWVTITRVKLTPDMQFARIYFTCMDDEGDPAQLTALLTRASGFFKGVIAGAHIMRAIPDLRFIHDDTEDRAAHIENLFDSLSREHLFGEGE